MLRKLVFVVAASACLVSAEDALGQFFYVNPAPGWSVVSQSQPSFSTSSWGGYNTGYSYYSGTVALPGWDASGYAPRMRASLEPAISMDQAGAANSGITPVSNASDDRESIRPVSSAYNQLIPRGVGTLAQYSYGTYGHQANYVRPVGVGYGCAGMVNGYR